MKTDDYVDRLKCLILKTREDIKKLQSRNEALEEALNEYETIRDIKEYEEENK